MGAGNSTNSTRRISFDNNFALGPALMTPKPNTEKNNIMDIEKMSKDNKTDFIKDNVKVKDSDKAELNYWLHRVEDLKKEHQAISDVIEQEYAKTMEGTKQFCNKDETEQNQKLTEQMKPCLEYQVKVIKCYGENPQHSLICSPLVQAFNQCVSACSKLGN